MEATFWMVWNYNGNAPTVTHAEERIAIQEAERLASKCPGETFVVLKSVTGRKVAAMQTIAYSTMADKAGPW